MTAYRNIVDVESVRQLSGDNSDHDKQRRYWPVDQRSRRIHPAFLQAVAVLCLCSVYEMKFTLSRTSRASLSNVVCSDSGENGHYNNDEVTVYTYYFCRHVPDWQGDGSGSLLTAEAHTHTRATAMTVCWLSRAPTYSETGWTLYCSLKRDTLGRLVILRGWQRGTWGIIGIWPLWAATIIILQQQRLILWTVSLHENTARLLF